MGQAAVMFFVPKSLLIHMRSSLTRGIRPAGPHLSFAQQNLGNNIPDFAKPNPACRCEGSPRG